MSMEATNETVRLLDQGVIIMNALLVLKDPERYKPRTATGVWLVLETPEGELCWELGEWRNGDQPWEAGWYLVGTETPIAEQDYTVRYWADEPGLDPLAKAVAP
jgi:hypothetical protein